MLTIFQEEMKYKNNIVFQFEGNEYFLFQILNFGNKTDELKFIFNDGKFNTAIIYNKDTGIQKFDDVLSKFGESTYHSDGSFFYKFPNFYLKKEQYSNPHGEGTRRTPLGKIFEDEPLFHYEVFRYQLCRKKKTISTNEKYLIQNDIFFDGNPFACVIMLINKNYSFYETYNQPHGIFIRLLNIAENLDLGIAFGKLSYKGYTIFDESLGRNLFSDNNRIQIIEKDIK